MRYYQQTVAASNYAQRKAWPLKTCAPSPSPARASTASTRLYCLSSAPRSPQYGPSRAAPGALVLAAEGKFFSNGGDLAWARAGPAPVDRLLELRAAQCGLVADFLALTVPTVAAVTGHAAGGGCALALAHDAIVMRASRGFLYMSEVDAGIKLDFVGELIRHKVPDAVTRRDLVMKGEKMTATEAVRRGIVDAAVEGSVEDVVAAAVAEAEELAGRGWDGENLADIRKATWPELWNKVKEYGGEAPARPRL